MKRNILLCVAGGTPAIITETLWALQKKGEPVDEIYVITTKEGRDKILFGKSSFKTEPDESLLDSEQGRFYRFQRDFPGYAHNIKFQSPESFYILTKKETGIPSPRDNAAEWLDDILTDDENEKIANQICEIVRDLCADENVRIHASIAGGRKTMSLYLMTAMQLFGRNWDSMSHVLVSKEVEFGAPKFFYKAPLAEPVLTPNGEAKKKSDGSVLTTDDVNIYLAEIPFIRLGGVGSEMLNKRNLSYAKIVSEAQEQLEKHNLIFNLKDGTFKIGNRAGKTLDKGMLLSNRDFFVYVMFAYLRWKNRGVKGFLEITEISLQDFDIVCRMISKAKGSERGYNNFMILRGDALNTLNYLYFRQINPSKRPETALSVVKWTFQDAISTIKKHLKHCGISETYAIKNQRKFQKKVEPFYGLEIDANQISFE